MPAMPISMPIVWSEAHRLHEGGDAVWLGVEIPRSEVPERAERIRVALEREGGRCVEPQEHPDSSIERVHDPALVAYLRVAWQLWAEAGHPDDPGQPRVVPYLMAHPGLIDGVEAIEPAAASARAGAYAFDTMTSIGEGTWQAARAAVDVALTATDLALDGGAAYALCRPPGHHVTRTAFGGSCYLNNAAIAAAHLRERLGGTIAIVDIDAHHGNGAQSIFYSDPQVVTASVHVDPEAGWFPHFLGLAREQGAGAGEGANRNLALAPGTGDDGWLNGVREAVSWVSAHEPVAVVVALGVDAGGGDPESPLAVTARGFEEAGRVLGGLGQPTVFVQEGGYPLDTIGELIAATLTGFESGAHHS